MAKLRLVVADRDLQSLQTLVSFLDTEFEIVGAVTDGPSAVDRIRFTKPKVVILDLNTPPEGGIAVTRQLAKYRHRPPVVICSEKTDSESLEAALEAGAIGFVLKARIKEDLIWAVQWAHQGRSFVSGQCKGGSADHAKFFNELGRRIRELREKAGYTQARMESFGFSVRHWQQIEGGRPIRMTTLLRICEVFESKLEDLLRGLDRDIYPD